MYLSRYLSSEDLADIRDQIQFNIDIPLVIQFDEAQFRQILINLILNAIRSLDSADAAYIQLNVHPYEHRVSGLMYGILALA